LANRVKKATDEIGENLEGMKKSIEKTAAEKDCSVKNTRTVHQAVAALMQRFGRMVNEYEDNRGKLASVAAAIEELSAANEEVFARIGQSKQASEEVAASVESAEKAIHDLFSSVEVIQEEMSQFTIGHGQIEHLLKTAFEARDASRQTLERLIGQGIDIFDRNYIPVPGTNPPKFRTSYDEYFERELQGYFDRIRQSTPGTIYALAVDNHGYLPCHHAEFSHPPTGNAKQDLVNSRHKRIYRSTRAEIRRAEHTSYCLLQTYLRDTGEILNDLSVPIHVQGRHWGNVIFGLQPEQFIHQG